MPAVAAVGRIGAVPITGRAVSSSRGSTCCTAWRTGLNSAIALSGTTVTAARLAKLLMVMLRLLIAVTLVTLNRLTDRR